MKLEFLANINNFIKKNTDHQIRHFSKARRKKKQDMDYSKIFDDEETIKRIKRKKSL